MIHVCYTLRDEFGKYSKLLGVSMQSLLDNTREKVTIHVIHDSTVSSENLEKLLEIVRGHGQYLAFYNVEKIAADKINLIKTKLPNVAKYWASIACFYRCLIPEILHLAPEKISRAIFLDADTVINLDIKDLWQIDLEDKPVGCVTLSDSNYPDDRAARMCLPISKKLVNVKDYFNDGMMLLDPDKIRSQSDVDLLTRCVNFLIDNKCIFFEQDALNVVFANGYKKLPLRYNGLVYYIKNLPDEKNVKDSIYHYVRGSLQLKMGDPFCRLWFSYFIRTPFCTPDSFANIFKTVSDIFNGKMKPLSRNNEVLRSVIRSMCRKNRVFFTDTKNIPLLSQIFDFKSGTNIGIDPNSPNSIQGLIGALTQTNYPGSDKKRSFFIYVSKDRYAEIRSKLVEAKFSEGDDFVFIDPLSALNSSSPDLNYLVRMM